MPSLIFSEKKNQQNNNNKEKKSFVYCSCECSQRFKGSCTLNPCPAEPGYTLPLQTV